MPYVLRKVNRAKWYENTNSPWLPQGELQADVFSSDLATKNNSMSVWIVDDEQSNFDRIVAALATNRDRLVEFDYALVNFDLVVDLRIKIIQSSGDTADSLVNTWHQDFVELTASKLFNFALVGHLGRSLA